MKHPKIIFSLLKQLKADFTPTFVRNFFKLQEQPLSSKAICDLLGTYNIESMTVRFTAAQLKEVTYPVLAVTERGKNKEYAILNELKTDRITYTNGNGNVIRETVEDFEKQWTGIAILIDAQNQKPEPGYKHNKRAQQKRTFVNVLTWSFGIFISWMFTSLLFNNNPAVSIPLLLLKITGIYVSIQLIKEAAGVHTAFSDRMCTLNEMTSCRKVLKSSAANIAGISLSDVGFLYFAVTILFLLISTSAPSFLALVHTGALLALPFTVFSVIYQWRVVKSWCPLCLLVLVLFWGEFIVFLREPYSIPQWPSVNEFILGTAVISTVVFLFYLFKKAWLEGLKGLGYQKKYQAFKNDTAVRNVIIGNGQAVTELEMLDTLELGNPEAANELIVVTGPTCGPCRAMHRELDEFLDYFNGYLSVKIVPSFPSNNPFSAKVSGHMVDFLVSGLKDRLDPINAWFRAPATDESGLEKWLSSYPAVKESGNYRDIITWFMVNKINYTPCLILNRKIVNSEYRLSDLKEHLKRKLDE